MGGGGGAGYKEQGQLWSMGETSWMTSRFLLELLKNYEEKKKKKTSKEMESECHKLKECVISKN